MNKKTFLKRLRKGFSSLPRQEREERLRFYSEMIDDRMEEGLTEEEAVAAIGTAEELAADIPPAKKRRRRTWEIVLLILGAPLWLSLLIAAGAVLLALFVSLWAVIVSLWAVFAAVAVCAVAGLAAGIVLLCCGSGYTGAAALAAGLVCAGVSLLLFFLCKAATKGSVWLLKLFARNRKEAAA